MKKFLTVMILLSMLFFGTSCGGSSKNKDEKPDTDEISEDQDTEEADEETDEETDEDDIEMNDDGKPEEDPKAVTEEEKLESIRNLAEEYLNFAHGTGVVVGYGYDKLTSFALGVRNSETKEQLQPDDLFEVGSITKNFTAVTLLLLQEEGKIDLDQTIDMWFPDFEKGDKITVRMLLNHTSGIMEMSDVMDPEDVVEDVNGRFNFEPGTSWAYINANFVLAGLIINKVAGKPAHEVIREKIIDPLGLTHTFMKGYEEYPEEAKAHGHAYYPNGVIVPYELVHKAWTAGALVSNAEDLFKYGYALFNGKILKKESMDQMLDIVELLGEPIYGLGTQYGKGSHSKFYGHGGDVYFSHAMLYYYPETGEIHIILNNYNESKDMYVLNDEMEYVLMDDRGAKKKTDFPDWNELINDDEHTQVFALYSIMADYPVYNLDYGIGYFVYPEDTYINYYCQQYMFRYPGTGGTVVKIAQECIEPKEYYVGPFKVQRTDVDLFLRDFEDAMNTGEPTHSFYVTKYDYFYDLENEFVYKYCYYLEDDRSGSGKYKTIYVSKDINPSQTEFYHVWGKAKMVKSSETENCLCYDKNGKERECTEADEYPPKEESDEPEETGDDDEIPDE